MDIHHTYMTGIHTSYMKDIHHLLMMDIHNIWRLSYMTDVHHIWRALTIYDHHHNLLSNSNSDAYTLLSGPSLASKPLQEHKLIIMMELHHCWLSSTLLFIFQIKIYNCKIDSSHDKWNLWDPVAKFDIDPANADRNILKCSLNRWLYIKNPESFVNYWNFGLNFTTFASHSSILYFVVVVPTWCRSSPRDLD